MTRLRLDAVQVDFHWDCPGRARRTIWDPGPIKERWGLWGRMGVRRRRCTPEQVARGATADFFNPFAYIRVLGLLVGAAFSVSWGEDNIISDPAPPEPAREGA